MLIDVNKGVCCHLKCFMVFINGSRANQQWIHGNYIVNQLRSDNRDFSVYLREKRKNSQNNQPTKFEFSAV